MAKLSRISLEKGEGDSCYDFIKIEFDGYDSGEMCGNRKKSKDWSLGWKFTNVNRLTLTFSSDESVSGLGQFIIQNSINSIGINFRKSDQRRLNP